MPPIPVQENQVQEKATAVVPCSSAAKATAATIKQHRVLEYDDDPLEARDDFQSRDGERR